MSGKFTKSELIKRFGKRRGVNSGKRKYKGYKYGIKDLVQAVASACKLDETTSKQVVKTIISKLVSIIQGQRVTLLPRFGKFVVDKSGKARFRAANALNRIINNDPDFRMHTHAVHLSNKCRRLKKQGDKKGFKRYIKHLTRILEERPKSKEWLIRNNKWPIV